MQWVRRLLFVVLLILLSSPAIVPCRDAETYAGIYEDIDGDARPRGAGFDMGADEFVPVIQMGDINIDSSINSGDAILALRIAAGLPIGNPLHTPTADELGAGDVNCDGLNNAGDVILILRKAAGLITDFPCLE